MNMTHSSLCVPATGDPTPGIPERLGHDPGDDLGAVIFPALVVGDQLVDVLGHRPVVVEQGFFLVEGFLVGIRHPVVGRFELRHHTILRVDRQEGPIPIPRAGNP